MKLILAQRIIGGIDKTKLESLLMAESGGVQGKPCGKTVRCRTTWRTKVQIRTMNIFQLCT